VGTRADFYIGRGNDAQWLGSVAFDGYQWAAPDCPLLAATTPDAFIGAVSAIATMRPDFTCPDQGWPWPWNDSRMTDYAYVLHDGAVHVYNFGRPIADLAAEEVDWFPDMSAIKNVAFGGRSGMLVVKC
jgi:hypothetical protein